MPLVELFEEFMKFLIQLFHSFLNLVTARTEVVANGIDILDVYLKTNSELCHSCLAFVN